METQTGKTHLSNDEGRRVSFFSLVKRKASLPNANASGVSQKSSTGIFRAVALRILPATLCSLSISIFRSVLRLL